MHRISLIFVSFIIFLIFTIDIFANDEDSTFSLTLRHYFKKIVSKPTNIINQPTIEANYGLSSIGSDELHKSLSTAFLGEILYGFTQIDSNFDEPLLYKSNFQYTFLSDISSHFKPSSLGVSGLTTDNWRFGFGHSSGWGWGNSTSDILLYQRSAFVITHMNFEQNPNNVYDSDYYSHFDMQFKFGTATSCGMNLRVYDFLYANLAYEHSIVFPRFMFLKWSGSYLIEIVAEKSIDVFDEKFLDYFEDYYPLYYFLMKNVISLGLYELRRHQMYWPFDEAAPLNINIVKFGVTMNF